jgi:hypothetical protein
VQVWGQGDVQSFEGTPSDVTGYDGELSTNYMGADMWLTDRWMAGVAVAHSRGSGDWRAAATSGSLATTMMAVHPYLHWSTGKTSLWATAGAGRGDAESLRPNDRTELSGLGLRLGLVELRRQVGASAGGFSVGLRADAGWAELRTDAGTESIDGQTAAVHQLRAGMDLSQSVRLAGMTLAPLAEAHWRRDGGAGQPGTGLELIGGLRVDAGWMRIDAQGRMLAVHSAAGYAERGVGVTLSLGNQNPHGLSLSVSPRWGDAATGGDALWQEEISRRYMPAATSDERAANARDGWALDVRGEYGMRLPGGRLFKWVGSVNHSSLGSLLQLGGQIGIGSQPASGNGSNGGSGGPG